MTMNQMPERIKTVNNMGFMFLDKNPVFEAFLNYADKTKGYVADIGSAFGYASMEALKRGGRILSIDLAQEHLDALNKNCPVDLV